MNNIMDDFIDMMDMKQGWIQDKFEEIFEMVIDGKLLQAKIEEEQNK